MKKHLIGFILLVTALAVVKTFFLPDYEPVRDIEHAKIILEKNGYHCVLNDRGHNLKTIIVSRNPIHPDPEFGFSWQSVNDWQKEKVFVFSHNRTFHYNPPAKSWGKISAIGDETLLTKIDELFR